MRILSWEMVKHIHNTDGLVGYFKIYPDGTEGMIEADYTWEEIVQHKENGGLIGVEY